MSTNEQLEQQYLQLQQGQQSVNDFEQWLYTIENLEDTIGEELYEALITLDYSNANVKGHLRKLLAAHIDVDRYKREAFVAKLDVIIAKGNEMAEVLVEMYDYYRKGYLFLEDLGMGVGFLIKVLPAEYSVESYAELADIPQRIYLNRIHLIAKKLAQRVKIWIEEEKIILFQEEEFTVGKLAFKDQRSAAEKESIIWEAEYEPGTDEISSKRNRLLNDNGHLISPDRIAGML